MSSSIHEIEKLAELFHSAGTEDRLDDDDEEENASSNDIRCGGMFLICVLSARFLRYYFW